MFGFLNLHKPLNWTSHDCVGKLRRILGTKKIGHGGTLDPRATGVLPMAVGKATKLLNYLPTDKAYRAVIRLGQRTSTDDLEGELLSTQDGGHLTLEAVEAQLRAFHGKITQIPPAYSAIQKDGKRLYQLARAGMAVDVPPRTVEIFRIDILDFSPGKFPEITAHITCGPGTYIRAIARDLGEALGVGGTLAALERTRSCGLSLGESLTLEQLEALHQSQALTLISPLALLADFATITLDETQIQRWFWGQSQTIAPEMVVAGPGDRSEILVLNGEGKFLGLGLQKSTAAEIQLKPKLVFPLGS